MIKKSFSGIILILLLLIASCSQEEKIRITEEYIKEEIEAPALIIPPIKELDPAFEVFEMNPDSGGIFSIPNSAGSTITIEPGILVDTSGQPIKGIVSFIYREFHDASSIYLAGIPLDYDAAGIMKRFQTAGMFELRAFAGGTEVFVDSGKVIRVSMGSFTEGENYHSFYLDEGITRNWHYVGDAGTSGNIEKSKLKAKSVRNSGALKIPLGPNYFSFNYLAALDVMLGDNTKTINQNKNNPEYQGKVKSYGLTWSDIYNYQQLEFQGNKYLASMLVWQNLSGVAFPSWVKSAESKLIHKYGNVYDLQLKDKRGNEHYAIIEAVMPLKSLFAFSPEQWKKKFEETYSKVLEEEKRLKRMADVYRTFEINKFGVYNSDRFINDERSVWISANFEFEEALTIKENMEVCYIGGDNRSLVKFPYHQWSKLILFPDQGGRIFALLPEKKIALMSSDQYNKIPFSSLEKNSPTELSFKMKTIGSFSTKEELEKLLGIVN